jgi:hypothetical protein
MTMAKKKRRTKWTSEFARWYADRYGETDRKLVARIAYHERKIAEERAERGENAT